MLLISPAAISARTNQMRMRRELKEGEWNARFAESKRNPSIPSESRSLPYVARRPLTYSVSVARLSYVRLRLRRRY